MILERKYKLTSKIGEGSFGYVVKGENLITSSDVAVKIEDRDSITLRNEAKIYRLLQNIIGVPAIYNYGVVDTISYIILEMLGPSLQPLMNGDQLLDVCKQSLDILRHVHNENVIHRDIKPENFLFDKDKKTLYLIDYGLSIYTNGDRENEIQRSRTGTPVYTSLSVHNGKPHHFVDDLESLGYALLWFQTVCVPWEGDDEEMIVTKKRYLLCDPENEDDLFIYDWVRYCRYIRENDKTSYEQLYNIMENQIV